MLNKDSIRLSELERNLVVNGLLGLRSEILERDSPSDEIDDLIIKIIDTPEKNERWLDDYEER